MASRFYGTFWFISFLFWWALPAHAVFNIESKNNVVVYYGQGPFQRELSYYCGQPAIDIIVLSFVHRFPDDGNGYIGTNFGNQCDGTVYEGPGDDPSSDYLLKNCNGAGMAAAINSCQNVWGKKMMLSLGGGVGGYTLVGSDAGTELADQLWEMFGPKQEDYDGPRPLDGPTWSIDIDGFDLDIEYAPTDESAGYIALAQRLREHFATITTKTYYLSTSPQCVVPDANVGAVMAAEKFDMVFIQFYNTPYCSAAAWVNANPTYNAGDLSPSPPNNQFSYDEWAEWIASTPSAGAKIMIGLLGSTSAGANPDSYVTPAGMNRLVMAHYCRESFGGLAIWEATHAYQNVVDGFPFYTNAKRALGRAYREPKAHVCPVVDEEVDEEEEEEEEEDVSTTLTLVTSVISSSTGTETETESASTTTTSGLVISHDGECGISMDTNEPTGKTCGETRCCSQWGWCGMTEAWCGVGCQEGYGNCWN